MSKEISALLLIFYNVSFIFLLVLASFYVENIFYQALAITSAILRGAIFAVDCVDFREKYKIKNKYEGDRNE